MAFAFLRLTHLQVLLLSALFLCPAPAQTSKDQASKDQAPPPEKTLSDVSVFAFSNDGKTLAAVGTGGQTLLFDAGALDARLTLGGSAGVDFRLIWSRDDRRLAVFSRSDKKADGRVEVWDVQSGKKVVTLAPCPRNAGVFSFGGDGSRFLLSNRRAFLNNRASVAQAWDIPTGKLLSEIKPSEAGLLAWSHDGRRLLVKYDSGEAELYNGDNGRLIKKLLAKPEKGQADPRSRKFTVRFSQLLKGEEVRGGFLRNGETIFLFSSFHPPQLIDVETGNVIATLDDPADKDLFTDQFFLLPHLGFPSWVESPDGRVILTSSDRRGVTVWDAATGKQIRRLPDAGIALRVSEDGRRFLSITPYMMSGRLAVSGDLAILDLNNGDRLGSVARVYDNNEVIAWSRDEKRALLRYMHVVDGQNQKSDLRLAEFERKEWAWLAEEGRCCFLVVEEEFKGISPDETGISWHKDGNLMAVPWGTFLSSDQFKVLDINADQRRERATLKKVKYAQFSPNGKWLVTLGGKNNSELSFRSASNFAEKTK